MHTRSFGNNELMIIDDNTHLPVFEVLKYSNYLENTGKSVNTRRTYIKQLLKWYNWCDTNDIEPLELFSSSKVAMATIQNFISYLFSKELKSTSINLCLSVVYSYYDYLSLVEIIEHGPSDYFPRTFRRDSRGFLKGLAYQTSSALSSSMFVRKDPSLPINYISWDQYHVLQSACIHNRDAAIIGLMFECGLRIGEVLGIHVSDVYDIQQRIVHIVYRGDNENGALVKRKAERDVVVSEHLAETLQNLMYELEDYDTDYLFVTMFCKNSRLGKPLTYSSVIDLCRRLSKKTKIKFHPHMLRHGYAQERINDDWDMVEVSRSLGHASIESTKIYAGLSAEHIREKGKEILDKHYENRENNKAFKSNDKKD